MRLPAISLPGTDGSQVSPGLIRGRAVFFVYPYTGQPGVPDPPGWDSIFGAHGSTPQALGYSGSYPEFRMRNVKVFGISRQTTHWQQEFVQRTALAFPLLSDDAGEFGRAVPLATFLAGDIPYYVRRTFLVENGEVLFERLSVVPPETDAGIMLAEAGRRWP
jgi:peroxiredoxin